MAAKRSLDNSRADSPASSSKKIKKFKTQHHEQPPVPDYDSSKAFAIHAKQSSAVSGNELPPLPPITRDDLRNEVFTHPSVVNTQTAHQSYDRLEFLGDAYVELMATRLLYSYMPTAPPRRLSALREQLCRNRTLAAFSRRYGLDTRLRVDRGESIIDKTYGDLFEAYVAAVVLCDGFAAAEAWLTALWTPILEGLGRGEAAADTRLAKEKLNNLVWTRNTQSRLEEVPLQRGDHEGAAGTASNQLVRLRLLYRCNQEPWMEVAQGVGVGKKDAGNNAAQQALDTLESNQPLQALIRRKEESARLRKEESARLRKAAAHQPQEDADS